MKNKIILRLFIKMGKRVSNYINILLTLIAVNY